MNSVQKLSFKGIILGALADVIGTNIWGIVAGVYLFQKYQLSNLSQANQTDQLKILLAHDPIISVLNLFIGGGFSILGGYIAARIAKKNELLNGALSSFLCVLSSLFAIGSASIISVLVGVTVNPILSCVGAYLRLLQIRKLHVATDKPNNSSF